MPRSLIVFILDLAAAAILYLPVVAEALPPGAPPPKNFSVSQFWYNCLEPVHISVQKQSKIYSSSDRHSAAIGKLTKGQRVTVLEQVDVLKQPGVAQVVGPFENNALNLSSGTEVYVLQEWEIDYAHAWHDGKEVEGGLPIGNFKAFAIKKKPIIEQWLKIQSPHIPQKVAWALNSDAFKDWNAINVCKQAYQQ